MSYPACAISGGHLDDAGSGFQPSRRAVLRSIGLAACGAGVSVRSSKAASQGRLQTSSSFVDILRQPDEITVFSETNDGMRLDKSGDSWRSGDVVVACKEQPGKLPITVTSTSSALLRVHLRWKAILPADLKVLGDAWERSYGELGWREIIPEHPMPWYFLAFDGRSTHGYGVKTGAGSLAFWLCDSEGISLWLDLRNGGNGVLLNGRILDAATIVTHEGHEDESSFAAAWAFCRVMSPTPRPLTHPVYGSNDWYYAYGNSSAQDILRDADLMVELAPSTGPRPFTIIDDGWQNHTRFPDMADLAASIRAKGARPGIWVRPLRAPADAGSLLLPDAHFGRGRVSNYAYDPTIPEAREKALDTVRQAVEWKYELVKHDFSTWELLGQWGKDMHASPTLPGWSLHDRSKTNAEVIGELYRSIRETAGEKTILIGCNVVGHLSAGIFELQRTGDDVSGKVWERTRRMGVNTLAFRLPQHGTFFMMDADCVPITSDIPWTLTRQWLHAVAASGTALLVSPAADATGAEQKQAMRDAFRLAAGAANAEPEDWLLTHTPAQWKNGSGSNMRYEWLEPGGAFPFEV
jgi:alpha-galactosidase